MKHLLLTITSSLALTCTAGCSLVFDASKTNKRSESQNAAALSAPLLEKKEAGIEVTWEVPSDPVDGFVIRYGEDRENLLKEATILRSELREERDSQYGPVYRYILRDISPSGKVFVSVAAFKGDALSDFSDAIAETR
jgi:hypothetical protein